MRILIAERCRPRVSTSIRQPAEGRRHRFSWINEWQDRSDRDGRPDGIELIVPDWFYQAVLDNALILTIDRAYFDLTGGLDRWLYRLVRKHGGRQRDGWRFDFHHLHQKSGALSPFKRFAFELRDIIRRQPLPVLREMGERGDIIKRMHRAFTDRGIERGSIQAIAARCAACSKPSSRIRNSSSRPMIGSGCNI